MKKRMNKGLSLALSGVFLTAVMVRLTPAAAAAEVELPEIEIYSGDAAPVVIKAVMDDSDIRFVEGTKFRITSKPGANGAGSKEYLEKQARKASVEFDFASGQLKATAPHLTLGSANANVTVELPAAVSLEISAKDGDVELSGVRMNKFAITTEDGDVILSRVVNTGKSNITTQDGDVNIFGQVAKLGKVDPNIKGDGKVRGDLHVSPETAGELKITTSDGDIVVH